MPYTRKETQWVRVRCPVCDGFLGPKKANEIKAFICKSEGCSETEHTFYPGDVKRPSRSKPWFTYYEKHSKCGCSQCEPTQ